MSIPRVVGRCGIWTGGLEGPYGAGPRHLRTPGLRGVGLSEASPRTRGALGTYIVLCGFRGGVQGGV